MEKKSIETQKENFELQLFIYYRPRERMGKLNTLFSTDDQSTFNKKFAIAGERVNTLGPPCLETH